MKKILSIVLVAAMLLFVLAACGSKKDSDSAKTDAEKTAADTQQEKTP